MELVFSIGLLLIVNYVCVFHSKTFNFNLKLKCGLCIQYKLFGEPVVKTCVENGTHHVDISGEPQVYSPTMHLRSCTFAVKRSYQHY